MLKKDFPLLSRNPGLVYLDSAATSQKPSSVIKAVTSFYEDSNANIHRGVYALSAKATALYGQAHEKAAAFIGAGSFKEIIFTKNATESINLVANCVDWAKGDEVVTTLLEHHSNFVPWQQLNGVKLNVVGVTERGELDFDDLSEKISRKTRLVAVTHCSNALGTIVDVKKVCRVAHDAGALCLVDASQSAPHFPLSVNDLECDFLAFSSHKMLGPSGVGVLYAREDWLRNTKPFLKGGDMIKSVSVKKAEWNYLPWKFEAGTPNLEGAVGFSAAVEYLNRVGLNEVFSHEQKLAGLALKRLGELDFVRVYGKPKQRAGIISFNVEGVHPHDVASILDSQDIAIRSGHHCCQPLMHALGVAATNRASFYLYNDENDVSRLVEGLEEVRKVFA